MAEIGLRVTRARHPAWLCLFNNVANAASYAHKLGLERVMILDWSVSTETEFNTRLRGQQGPSSSLHRFRYGTFTSLSDDADYGNREMVRASTLTFRGTSEKMGTAKYFLAFQNIVLPVGMSQPELRTRICWLDAAEGDPQRVATR